MLAILNLEELEPLLFRGRSPPHPRWGRIYGGQTVSQSLIAAARTVQPPFVVHSLHAYFLRAGDDNEPVLYSVECLRDGRNFVARRVSGRQHGLLIFVVALSFHAPEPSHGLEHQDAPPAMPRPDQLPSMVQTMWAWAADARLSEPIRAGILRSATLPFAFDVRRGFLSAESQSASVVDYLDQRLSPQPHATQNMFMKVSDRLPDHLILHQCALAYLSDWSALETVLLPHGIHSYQNTPQCSIQMASLDHTLFFPRPFRADEWLLYALKSSWAGGARGLARGKFFDHDDNLIVSVTQEGLVRLRAEPTPAPPTEDEEPQSADRHRQPSNHFTLLPTAKL